MPDKAKCAICKTREVAEGECSTSRAAAGIGICSTCYKDAPARERRREALGLRPGQPVRLAMTGAATTPPVKLPAEAQSTCSRCHSAAVSDGHHGELGAARLRGLCLACYRIVRDEEFNAEERPGKPVERPVDEPLRLDGALAEFDSVSAEIGVASAGLQEEAAEMVTRTRIWLGQLAQRTGALRQALRDAEGKVREANAEARRTQKEIGLARQEVKGLSEKLDTPGAQRARAFAAEKAAKKVASA